MGARDRLNRIGARPHLPRRSVRLRLTVLYGALFLGSGVALLTLTYLLVSRATGECSSVQTRNGAMVALCQRPGGSTAAPSEGSLTTAVGDEAVEAPGLTPQQAEEQVRLLKSQAMAQRDIQLDQLLVQSGIALGGMTIVSIGLGWIVAGRVLRPLRTITSTARRISATNLHERLALAGPNDELRELGDTFDQLLARLERSFDAQRRFVANASHELRTPLARQRTVAQVALADPEATVDSLRAAHESVLASGAEQARLVDTLLTLARGQTGLRRREPFDVAGVANDVLLTRREEAEERGVEVHQALSPAPVEGDRRLVERLVANLLDNALHYNRSHGHVDVVVGSRAGHAVLSVTNTGPVVPASEIERLMQPFQQNGPHRTARGQGLGLGLSIVQAIAESHDAELAVSPRAGGGLVVEIRFQETTMVDTIEPTSESKERTRQGKPPAPTSGPR